MTTTVSAVILGIILVVTIHPGQGNSEGIKQTGTANEVTTPDLLMDLVRSVGHHTGPAHGSRQVRRHSANFFYFETPPREYG